MKSGDLQDPIGVFGIGQNVTDMNDFAFKQDAARYRSTVDSRRMTCGELGVFMGKSIGGFEVESFAPRSSYGNRVRSTACRSNAERLMTFSTSAVAVCCCKD